MGAGGFAAFDDFIGTHNLPLRTNFAEYNDAARAVATLASVLSLNVQLNSLWT